MERFERDTYGEAIADLYDDWLQRTDTADTVEFLGSLAGGGPVLELAVGTGRVAVPLAGHGLAVHGIDASPAMVDRLRAKEGGDRVTVTIGDMADVGVDGPFSVVFVVFNSFFAMLTQHDQARCFANVADRLRPGGCFVIECFVPDMRLFDHGQRVGVSDMEVDRVRLDVTRHFSSEQRVETQHVVISSNGVRLVPVVLRYAWPSELDLMARLGGLHLRERFGGWRGEPFGDESPLHVSVYEKPAVA